MAGRWGCWPCHPDRKGIDHAVSEARPLAHRSVRHRRGRARRGDDRPGRPGGRPGADAPDRVRPRLHRIGRPVRDAGAALRQQRLPQRRDRDRSNLGDAGDHLPDPRRLLRRRDGGHRRRPDLRGRPLAGHVGHVRVPEQLTRAGRAGRQVHRHRRVGRAGVPRRRRVHWRLGTRQPGPRPRADQRAVRRTGPHAVRRIGRVVRRPVRVLHRAPADDDGYRERAGAHRDLRPRPQLPGQHRDRRQRARRVRGARRQRHAAAAPARSTPWPSAPTGTSARSR